MKHNISIALTTLVVATLACKLLVNTPFSNIETGPTETFSIDEPLSTGSATTNVRLSLAPGLAALTLGGGAPRLVEGEIRYKLPNGNQSSAPAMAHSESSRNCQLTRPVVSQGRPLMTGT